MRDAMLAYVRESIASEGTAPSYGMICRALGIRTREQVSRMVQAAERDGQLKRVGAGKVRRIQLT
jgi:SOS-response transcriptional repressor LexA